MTRRVALACAACGCVLPVAFASQWWLGRSGHSPAGPGMLLFAPVAAGLWFAITGRRRDAG